MNLELELQQLKAEHARMREVLVEALFVLESSAPAYVESIGDCPEGAWQTLFAARRQVRALLAQIPKSEEVRGAE